MGKIFFRKRDRIRQLEGRNWHLHNQIERQDYSFQLTVPTFSGDVRFSGSPEAIAELNKHFDMEFKKRKSAPPKSGGQDK